MSFNKKFFTTGGIVASSDAVCRTEDVNPFTGTSADNGVALYSLDYDATDTSGNFDGTPTDVDFGVGGITNFGAKFNGSSSFIQTSLSLDAASNSISFWFNADSVGSQNPALYFNNRGGRIDITINGTGSNTATATLENIFINSTTAITGWNFVSIVFTGWASSYSAGSYGSAITANVYLNGGSAVSLSPTPYGQSDGLRIGRSGGSYYYDGDIDQVRIFSKALSTSEIDTLYNSGSGETACVHTSTTDDINFPTTNLAYYKLDNSAEDSHSGTYDGTESNIEYRFGRFGQALKYSASTSSTITTSLDSTDLATNFSVSFWIKLDSPNSFQVFNGLYSKSPISNQGWVFYTQSISSSYYFGWLWYYDTSQNYNTVYNNSIPIVADTWYHVALSFTNGSLPTLYVNGTASNSNLNSTTTAPVYNAGSVFQIGSTPNTNLGAGFTDQVRLFNSALSSSQVTELYNEKPETDTSNFKTVLYEGTGATQYISNVGMDLETSGGLIWTKRRTGSNMSHAIVDNVRGISESGTNYIASDRSDLQASSTNMPSSLEANGFFVQGNGGRTNTNGEDYVSWVWLGGGDAVAGTGSGVSAVSVSANTAAGFSIVKYTGGNSASDTVNHGLTDAEMIILKDLNDGNNNWRVWHKDLTANHWLYLNLTNAEADAASDGGIRNVDSNSFGFINGNSDGVEGVNSSVSSYIAYVWKSISGYSSIGSYEGNGNTQTTPITTDFEPSWVMIKRIDDVNSWRIFDTRRDTTPLNLILDADTNLAEADGGTTTSINITSTGFNMGTSQFGGSINAENGQYIYLAFK